MAATLASKIIHPERPAIGVCSDGRFAMQMHVLLSALQYEVAPVYVVMNNSSFGMTSQGMGNRSVGNAFPKTDYAAIARSFGCFAEQVRRPGEAREAIGAALRQDRPAVIDVVIDADQNMKNQLYSPLATEVLAGTAMPSTDSSSFRPKVELPVFDQTCPAGASSYADAPSG